MTSSNIVWLTNDDVQEASQEIGKLKTTIETLEFEFGGAESHDKLKKDSYRVRDLFHEHWDVIAQLNILVHIISMREGMGYETDYYLPENSISEHKSFLAIHAAISALRTNVEDTTTFFRDPEKYSLKIQIAGLHEEQQKLESQLAHLRTETETLKAEVELSHIREKATDMRFTELEVNYKAASTTVQRLKTTNAALDLIKTSYGWDKTTLQHRLNQADLSTQAQIGQFTTNMEKKNADISQLQQEVLSLKDTQGTLETELEDLRTTALRRSEHLAAQASQVSGLNSEKEALENQCRHQEDELRRLRRDNRDLVTQNEQMRASFGAITTAAEKWSTGTQPMSSNASNNERTTGDRVPRAEHEDRDDSDRPTRPCSPQNNPIPNERREGYHLVDQHWRRNPVRKQTQSSVRIWYAATRVSLSTSTREVTTSFSYCDAITNERDDLLEVLKHQKETQQSCEKRARDDRADFVKLKKKLTDDKKTIEEECAKEKVNGLELCAKIQKIEGDNLEWEQRGKIIINLENRIATITEELQQSESTKAQILHKIAAVSSVAASLVLQKEALAKEQKILQTEHTQLEERYRDIERVKLAAEKEIGRLMELVTQHQASRTDLQQGIADRDADIQDLKSRLHQGATFMANLPSFEHNGPSPKRIRTSQGHHSSPYSVQPRDKLTVSWDDTQDGLVQHGLPSPDRSVGGHRQSTPACIVSNSGRFTKGGFMEVSAARN
ncbi:uncharacterized protein LY89DRAFT_667591 [Mollisia scopiformis]|uniref:Uncharacterized protein n=1 Tax=Mollisia scopiformis TaxID=149040 RepID=A0A194XFF5_MOLSC|nr:uncharacterized protein LY89DRAFT_667591 [Mollisia scopiformis]KUJ18502.1 hypothetical protein LY89DRAFT_667591 [Mollisia scopiformis]